jgi:tRNA dimethylallyltransferase
MSKKVYIIVGPTAVGKTAFAIQLAKQLQTEIISADARQCYKELSIGVARPSKEELVEVPHHFIASHSIHEKVDAVVFEQYALQKVTSLFETKDAVVMVGGTGLYIKAFCEGMDDMPSIDPTIREGIIQQYESEGIEWLQNKLKAKDPAFWAQAEQHNPQRLMRALEVLEGTGKSILTFQQSVKKQRDFEVIKIGLEMDRALLNERIRLRVDQMIQEGLENEVKSLLPYFHLNALQTVGYSEWLPYFEHQVTIEEVALSITTHTRQYAKRQMTWFKKDKDVKWFQSSEVRPAQIIS